MQENLRKVNHVKELQLVSLQAGDTTPYALGLYNGLELAVALMEGKEPEFARLIQQPTEILEAAEPELTLVDNPEYPGEDLFDED